MKKKLIITLLIVAMIIVAGFGYYIIQYPMDPFKAPPKGTSPNCGPEHRYEFDLSIKSEKDFLDFIKNNNIDNFYLNNAFLNKSRLNWEEIENSIIVTDIGSKNVYSIRIDYYQKCFDDFKMTSDGHVSIYGCCGI